MADVAVNFTGKVCGINLTSKPGHPMEADYWSEWDFNNWIRKQTDYGYSVGGRVFRLIGDVTVVNSNTISQATYNARLQQWAAYVISLGCAIYYTGCATYGTNGVDNGTTSLSDATIAAIINSNIGAITGVGGAPDYSANIIGCDIVQEANANLSAGRVNNIYSLVKPNVPSPIGCTFSTTALFSDSTWIPSIIGSCDYLDYHIYPQIYGINAQPTPTDFTNGPMTTYPTKDLLFGEGGCSYSGPPSGGPGPPWSAGGPEVAAWITGMAALQKMSGSHARGAMPWSVFEQDISANTTNLYGFFDEAGPFTPLTSSYIYPWARGVSAVLSPQKAATPINPHDLIILVSPTPNCTSYTGVNLYRDSILVSSNTHGYFDQGGLAPGTYTFQATISSDHFGTPEGPLSDPLVVTVNASPGTRVPFL